MARGELKGHKKVHIVPIAFEVERAVQPVIDNGADRVYILTGAQETDGPMTSAYGQKAKQKLQRHVKQVITVNYGYYDYVNIFAKLVEIGREEKGNYVLINLSTGGHIVTIAATVAASMFGWIPYYVEPETYNIERKGLKDSSSGIKRVFEIQTYPIERPGDELVKCLSLMEGVETQMSIMRKLEKSNMLEDAKPGESFTKRSYMEFKRRYMDPLLEKKWMRKDGRGKRSRLEITDSGKEIVRIFG